MRTLPIAVVLFAVLPVPAWQPPADQDRDGLADAFEDEILRRFRPRFHVSRKDCDVLPSEFQPGLKAPKSIARNGAIYGQVFPLSLPGREGVSLEVHYLHLWKQDCGRVGHYLDAEHVTALLSAESLSAPAAGWKAVYWYAAAHEGTACDSGNGARALALNAENQGPHVWISHGKHASYLSLDLCRSKGCGGDQCRDMVEAAEGPLVNLGEWAAPLNGATWVHGGPWKLGPKFASDFDPATLAQFEKLDQAAAGPVYGSVAPVKAVFLAGGEVMGAVQTGGRHTDQALRTADRHTTAALDTAGTQAGNAVSKGASATGRSLKRALKSVAGALGGK